MIRKRIATIPARQLPDLIRSSAFVFLALALSNMSNAAEQWGWKAEVRRGSVVEASDPTVYPNQGQAEAAMRSLLPPFSPLLTKASPGHGNPNNGSIQIEFSAPQTPIIFGQPVYTIGLNPVFFGHPPDLSNPLNAATDDDLADAINERHKAQRSAVCADRDRAVVVEPLWGPAWTSVGNTPGVMNITGKQYSYTSWAGLSAQPGVCGDFGRTTANVWRTMEENCPAGYDQITSHDPNSGGFCFSSKTGVVRGTPHQCEVTPISTTVGNPCDTVTGAKTETETDYASNTVSLTRSYNSHAQAQNSFGTGWMHNYDRRLSITRATPRSFRQPSMLVRPSGVANLLRGITADGEAAWQSTSGNGLLVKQEGTNYRNYLRSGTTELYDTDGYLLELVDAAGRATTIDRDGNGLITKVTGPFGKTLTFNYDTDSRLTSIDDPAGNAIQYGYGANDELTSVTYQDNTVRQYHYEDPSLPYHLTGITDENGDRYSTFSFDATGRTISTEHAGGFERLQLEYFPTQTIVTDAAGTERTFQFTTDSTKLRKLTAVFEPDATTTVVTPSYSADRQRRPTQFVDANGVITEFEYDDFHLIRKTEAKGTPEERITDFEYLSDDSSLVTLKMTQSVFSGGVRSVMTDYGGDNLPDSVTISGFTPSGDPIQRTMTTTYNSFGKRLTVDGPRTDVNDITTFDYYDCATGAECGQLKSMTNALKQVTTFDNYDAHRRLLQTTDPNGLVTTNVYDLLGRVVSVEENSPGGVTHTTLFVYDNAGQLTSTTSPDGLVVSSTYNAAHLLTSTQDSHGNRIDYGYDLRGNQTDVDVFDPLGVLRRAVDNSYDIRNRIASVNAGGFVSTVTSDALGNVKEQVDPALATTAHEYDGLNRPFRTTDAELGEMLRSFNNLDNIVEIIAPNGATTTFEYDDLGNLLKETSPDRGELVYSYDDAGDRLTETDARGMTTTNSYDALNRVTSRIYQDGQLVTFEYDQSVFGIGRLNRMIDPSGQTEWDYDAFGQELVRRQTTAGQTLETLHSYDSAGRLASMTLPSGMSVVYSYNLDQMVSMTVDGQSILSGASYEPFGAVNGWTWGDGTTHARTFDLRGLLTSHSIGSDTRLLDYDTAGRVSGLTDARQSLSFEYDLLGRLTSAGPSAGSSSGAEPLFVNPPVFLASIQTMKNEIGDIPNEPSSPWLTVAAKKVTAGSAKVSLERGQVNTGSIDVKEKIGYLAIETGSGGSFADSGGNTITYEAQITPEIIKGWDTGCFETSFLNTYSSKPVVMASLHSHNGGDGGWLRRCSLNKTALGLTVDEDKFGDSERRHNNAESAGIVAFSSAFDAQFTDSNGSWGMEIAKVRLPSTANVPTFTRITFRQAYATKPVVIVLPNKSGNSPASVRIRNVRKTGFEVVQVEPAPENGTHKSMPIHYLAIEPGIHTLPNGTKLVVGRKATKKQKHGSGVVGNEGWATVKFGDSAPTMSLTQAFTYDANGNRTVLTEEGVAYPYSYVPGSNRLLSTDGPVAKTLSYDLAGNVISDGSRTFDFDARGRMVAIDGGLATYSYNGFGERVRKTTSSDSVFVYDLNQQLIGEYDTTGNPIQEFVNFGGLPVAVLDTAGQHLVHTDHLGTPREITSSTETVWRWESTPFGVTLPDDDPDGDGITFDYNMRFPGQYFDIESDLHYNYFRDYDPKVGRYMESDPIGLQGGPSTYAYVGANPTNSIDPLGLIRWTGLQFQKGGSSIGPTKAKFTWVLVSDCYENEKVLVTISGENEFLTSLSVGFSLSDVGQEITLFDSFEAPGASNLSATGNNDFVVESFNYLLGSISKTQLGHAATDGFDLSVINRLDVSLARFSGKTQVVDERTAFCCEE